MLEKIKKLNKFLKKMDFISKMLLTLILLVIIVNIFNKFVYFSQKQPISENKIVEISDKKDLKIVDYSFDSNSKDRYPEDSSLILIFSKEMSEEEKKNLNFKFIPSQAFKISYPNSYSIVLKFEEVSPKNDSNSIVDILYEGKRIDIINYTNLKYTSETDPPVIGDLE